MEITITETCKAIMNDFEYINTTRGRKRIDGIADMMFNACFSTLNKALCNRISVIEKRIEFFMNRQNEENMDYISKEVYEFGIQKLNMERHIIQKIMQNVETIITEEKNKLKS